MTKLSSTLFKRMVEQRNKITQNRPTYFISPPTKNTKMILTAYLTAENFYGDVIYNGYPDNCNYYSWNRTTKIAHCLLESNSMF